MSVKRSKILSNIASYLAAALLMVFALFPLMWSFLLSFQSESDILDGIMRFSPLEWTASHYQNVWVRGDYPRLLGNSAMSTGLTVLICLCGGVLASYALSRGQFRGRNETMMFYLLVRMVPSIMLVIPMFIILRSLNLLDSTVGLSIAYSALLLPVFIWMMKGFFDGVPAELDESARIDGCTRAGALWRIVLPVVKGGLVASAVFIAIAAWNDYLIALLMTSSTGSRTWPVGLQMLVGQFQLPWGSLAAGGMISILPVAILFALFQRLMVKGLTAGAVKG
ncbi:carbohydrate ABC transporter permease [Devosia sp. A449]